LIAYFSFGDNIESREGRWTRF